MKINIPASIGELLDKITILEIKKNKIKESKKLIEINKELKLLNNIVKIKKLKNANISKLKNQLKKINIKLWNVEDRLRVIEGIKIFDSNFVKNARSVYKLNDKRSSIKSKINILTKSNINEVKSYESY